MAYIRLHAYLVDKGPHYKKQRNLFPGKWLRIYRILAQMCGKPIVMHLIHRDIVMRNPTMVSGAAKPMRWKRRRK